MYTIRLIVWCVFALPVILSAAPLEKIWFDQPAEPARWETEALPVGNGKLGALLFGGTGQIFVHFNEDSLWLGHENDTGSFQSFGNFTFDFAQSPQQVSDYGRELDISTGVHTVRYTGDGVAFSRTTLASHPAGVLMLACSADRRGQYSGTLKLNDDHDVKGSAVADDTLQITGKLKNGMTYAARVRVVAQGGKIKKVGDALEIEGADALWFYLAAATNYIPDAAKKWQGGDPVAQVSSTLAAVVRQSPEALRTAHIRDHRSLYHRVEIDLGESDPALDKLTTKERLLNFWKTRNDPDFEELVFKFGRYCLIASSRPGSLPANLQGVWNRSNNPPWRSDYHSDINVDMNYWLAEPTNLSELRQPFFDYVRSQIPVATVNTKKKFNTRGWTVQYENGIHGGGSYRWNHSGSSWFAQQFWNHYAYTLDREFLRNEALPVFRGVCEFWEDWLVERDGHLVAPQGWSPEHGPTEDGVTYDQMFAWDAFTNYIDACAVLGVEREYAEKIKQLRARLMPLKIGGWGQIQEWLLVERDRKKEGHRHLSHLVGLYPGRQINTSTPELLAAAKVSLVARGGGGAGWALPWKAVLWSYCGDAERARDLLVDKLKPVLTTPGRIRAGSDGTTPNLFTVVWSVMQIDGTFGYSAAVAEMLVQSHEPGKLHLLPTLPKAWANGSIRGFKARGGHTVALTWKDGALTAAEIIRGPGPLPTVWVQGKPVAPGDTRVKIGNGK